MSNVASAGGVREFPAVVPLGYRTSGPAPTGTRIVLLRHGEARCNVDGVVGGHSGCRGLTERGRRQAERLGSHLADWLAPGALYCSALPRARETADALPLEQWGLVPQVSHDWCELEPGEADGLTWDQVEARYGSSGLEDPSAPFSPGGESRREFFARVREALLSTSARHPGDVVVVACHGGVIEQAVALALGFDESARLLLRTEHCSWTELDVAAGEIRLLSYNERVRVPTAD